MQNHLNKIKRIETEKSRSVIRPTSGRQAIDRQVIDSDPASGAGKPGNLNSIVKDDREREISDSSILNMPAPQGPARHYQLTNPEFLTFPMTEKVSALEADRLEDQ